ncbi:MAG: cyclic nucleotide-binding domain-containing protein [Gammaproteobacteria bacterium]
MKKVDKKILKNLNPFKDLSADKINEIVNKAKIEELPATRVLFRQGDHDKRTYFLLAGQIELTTPGKSRATVLKAKTSAATSAIEQTLPRTSTARTKTAATLLSIDTDLLDILTADDSIVTSYEVTELDVNESDDDASDWMLRFLQSKAFLNLPTENIQNLLMKMTEVDYKKGDVVVKQGTQDDYYYIIKSGKCDVSRRPAPKVKDVKLAILTIGDGFGEEALITNGKRNASVTMKENGSLMRLTKEDFNTILVQPLLEYIDEETASKLVKSGARLIDVRSKDEFKNDAIEGAMNIPLSMLRNRATSLNPSRKYVVYCDSGNRSAAAAFLMCQLGLQCSVIQSGMTSCDKLLRPKENELPKAQRSSRQATATAETESHSPIVTPVAINTNKNNSISDVKIAKTNIASELESLQIPTLNDDEIDLIKTKAEKEFSEKLEKERKESIKKATQIEKDYQAKLEQERIKASQANQESKKALQAEKNYQEKLKQEHRKAAQAADETKKAQQEIERIKKEALTIREHSQLELNRYKNEIEKERKRVESELKKSQKEASKRVKVEKKILAQQEKAEAEVQIAKQQISNIKSDTEREIEELRAELQQRKKEQQILEHKRLEAEEKSSRADKLLEKAKQEANNEINTIRSKVEQEKTELENAIKKHKQETELQLQKNTDVASKAQKDAENAVIQLRSELKEKDTQNRKLEEQEKKTKELADKLSIEAEEARLSAEMEAAHFRAEAESIREEAKSEANKLKNEVEASRRILQEQAKIAQAEAEQARLIRQQAEEEKRLSEQEKITQKAKNDVADARKQIELEIQEAKQLARETELARMAKAEAEAFERTRLETEQLAKRNADEAAKRAVLRTQQIEQEHAEEQERQLAQLRAQEQANLEAKRNQELAKQKATAIAAKLQKKAKPEFDVELQSDLNSDISLAKSTVVEKDGRIILEGENDIFIFQRPDPEEIVFEEQEDEFDDIPVLETMDRVPDLEISNSIDIDIDEDLFDFEEANNANDQIFTEETSVVSPAPLTQARNTQINEQANFNPTDSVALSSNRFLQTNNVTSSQSFQAQPRVATRKLPRNKTLTLIATTTVVITIIGIFSATNETYFNFDKVLAWLEPNQEVVVEETETRRLSRIAAAQSRAELNVKENAASEFKTMLEKWKDSVELGPDR